VYKRQALSRVKYYADEGNFDAQKNLADMYYTGDGVKKDYAEAFNLYSKIAEQDDTGYSYYVLAEMYDKGQGREKNPDEALEFYQLASDKGNAESAYRLSQIFMLRRDMLQSVRYLKQAMNSGHEKAKEDYHKQRAGLEDMQRDLEKLRKIAKLRGSSGIEKFNAEMADVEKNFERQLGLDKDKVNALFAEYGVSLDLSPLAKSSGAYINGDKVNIRAEPNTRAKVLLQLNKGDPVTILETTGGGGNMWYKVETSSGTTGWVSGKFVTKD